MMRSAACFALLSLILRPQQDPPLERAPQQTLSMRFGKLEFSRILAPAIYYAENGRPGAEMTAGGWRGDGSAVLEVSPIFQ